MFTSPHFILYFCWFPSPSYYFPPLPSLAPVPPDLFPPAFLSFFLWWLPPPAFFFINPQLFLFNIPHSLPLLLLLFFLLVNSFTIFHLLFLFLQALTPFDFSLLLLSSSSSDGYLRLLFSSFVYPSSSRPPLSLQSKRNVQSLAQISVASMLLGFFGLNIWCPRMSLRWGWYYLHKMFEKVVLRVNFLADRLTDHALPPTRCSHLV